MESKIVQLNVVIEVKMKHDVTFELILMTYLHNFLVCAQNSFGHTVIIGQ